jgi:hypothetical protein
MVSVIFISSRGTRQSARSISSHVDNLIGAAQVRIVCSVPGHGGCREDRFEVLPCVFLGDLEP